MTMSQRGISETLKYGILAGAAGGVAEVVWVSLHAAITGGDAAILARGVTTAAGITALLPAAPVTMGIAVHMALAALLGIALAGLWQTLSPRAYGAGGRYIVVLAALVAVWAVNFFVILPAISPAFALLIPYPVSLMSKLLFGLAAAETLRRCMVADVAVMPATLAVQAADKKRYPAG